MKDEMERKPQSLILDSLFVFFFFFFMWFLSHDFPILVKQTQEKRGHNYLRG